MNTKKEENGYLERKTSRSRYDQRLILKIVNFIESGVPRKAIEKEYGVSHDSLAKWLRKYGSGDYIPRVLKFRASSEKRSIVRAVEAGMSIKEAQIAFDIPQSATIKRWIQDFDKENAEIGILNIHDMQKNQLESASDKEKALQKALEQAQLKIKALDTLIDIAEEEFKITIRKKSGAKQSPQ